MTGPFADKIRKFPLRQTAVAPRAVSVARWVDHPEGILDGRGAVMDAARGESQLVIDFGRETVGGVTVQAHALRDTAVTIHYGEDLEEALRTEEFPANWYKMPKDEYELAEGPCVLTNRGRRAFRYVHLRIPAGGGRLRVESISATFAHYPVERRGAFRCPDALLGRIWEMSYHTTLCCMQQYYEDGVKRDGLLWVGDYRVEFLCNALCFGDAALARKCLYMFAATQEADGAVASCAVRGGGHQHPFNIEYMPTLPDAVAWGSYVNYCTDFVASVREYHDFTGDAETLRDLWAPVVAQLEWLWAQDLDTLEPGGQFIADVPSYQESWWGARAMVAMQLYEAARDAAVLARRVGDKDVLARCGKYLTSQKALCTSRFFSVERGVFLDDPPAAGISWHANAMAVVSGVVDPAAGQDILRRAGAEPDASYPIAGFAKFWTVLGKYLSGMDAEALDDIREYWGHMLSYGATTGWDLCDIREDGIDHTTPHALSQCHGWTAGPCYFFPAMVLGVRPAEPGLRSVRIRPHLADLPWAEGTVPTPHGEIFVHWDAVGSLTGHIRLPEGVSGQAVLPAPAGEVTRELREGWNQVGPT